MSKKPTDQEAYQSIYDGGFYAAIDLTWRDINVLGCPQTAVISPYEQGFHDAIAEALNVIDGLRRRV